MNDQIPSGLGRALRALPDFDPPADVWATLQQRRMRQERARRWRDAGQLLATAAAVVLALGVALLWPEPQQPPAAQAQPALPELMAQSVELEGELRELRARLPVWDARSAERAARLRQGLQALDLQLAAAQQQDGSPDQQRALWSSRVDLMGQLVQTHREAGHPPDMAGTERRGDAPPYYLETSL